MTCAQIGDHPEKQGDRGQSGGFLHNGAKHGVLPERTKNIVHCLFYVKSVDIRRTVDNPGKI